MIMHYNFNIFSELRSSPERPLVLFNFIIALPENNVTIELYYSKPRVDGVTSSVLEQQFTCKFRTTHISRDVVLKTKFPSILNRAEYCYNLIYANTDTE